MVLRPKKQGWYFPETFDISITKNSKTLTAIQVLLLMNFLHDLKRSDFTFIKFQHWSFLKLETLNIRFAAMSKKIILTPN